MAVCERCWGDAYARMMGNGRPQYDNYLELLEERKDNPCKPPPPKDETTR